MGLCCSLLQRSHPVMLLLRQCRAQTVGQFLAFSTSSHALKRGGREKKGFHLQEILSLKEAEKKTTWENATVLFKSRLAVGGSPCRSPLCPPGIALK